MVTLGSNPSLEEIQRMAIDGGGITYCHVQASNCQSAYGIGEVIEQMVLCQRPIKLTWTARNPIDYFCIVGPAWNRNMSIDPVDERCEPMKYRWTFMNDEQEHNRCI